MPRSVFARRMLIAAACWLPMAAMADGMASRPAAAEGSGRLERVTLQLKWRHSFQFAGYYAAIAKGFYRDVGLEVELVEHVPGLSSVPLVLSGSADYGIGSSDLLQYRARGAPVVVLAAIFQHSPSVLITRDDIGIESLEDLRGKRIMAFREDFSLLFDSLFWRSGIDAGDMQFVPHTGNLQDFIEGRVDAMSAYVYNQPYDLDRLGIPYRAFNPREYGLDAYNDCLFTIESELKRHPRRVAAFRAASLRGWEYALQHPQEMIDLILTQYDPTLSREKQENQARVMAELAGHGIVEIGYMNPGRWRALASEMVSGQCLSTHEAKSVNFDVFLFDPNSDPNFQRLIRMLGCGVLVLLAVSAGIVFVNIRLRQLVAKRTASLRRQQTNLEAIIQSMPTMIVVADPQRNIFYANSAACDTLGYTLEDLVQLKVEQLHPEAMRDETSAKFAAMTNGKTDRCRLPLQCRDGTLVVADIRIALGLWNGKVAAFSAMHDMRDHLAQEIEIRESEQNFKSMAHASRDGIVVIDRLGAILFANTRFSKMTGTESDALKTISFWECFDKTDKDRLRKHLDGMYVSSDENTRMGETTVQSRQRGQVPVEISAAKITWHRRDAIMLEISDLSWQRRMQVDLLRARDMEKQCLGRELHDGIAQQLAAASYLSHSLADPDSKIGPWDAARLYEIQRILRDTLAAISGLARSMFPDHVTARNFRTALERFAERTANIFSVDCRLTDAERMSGVQDDPSALQIFFIVQESVMNALRHGRAKQISISALGEDGRLEGVLIEDNGWGFDASIPSDEGMGLRLMRYRAEMIGASLRIDSQAGRGTRVYCEMQERPSSGRSRKNRRPQCGGSQEQRDCSPS